MKTLSRLFVALLLAAAVRAEEDRPGPHEGMEPPPAEVDRFLEEVRRDEPALAEEMLRARREHPEQFARHARGFGPMIMDPDGRVLVRRNLKADFQVRRLGRAYREAKDPGEKRRLEGELRQAIEAQFDAKLAAHEMHLKKMSSEINRLKERIEKRRKSKAQLVDKKLAELAGDEEGWDW